MIGAVMRAGRLLPYALITALLIWGVYERFQHRGWKAYAERLVEKSEEAERLDQAIREAKERDYAAKAKISDEGYGVAVAASRELTNIYLDARRVQDRSCRPAESPGSSDTPEVSNNLPAPVIVDEADVRAASEWETYGIACRNWAILVTQPAEF